MEAYAPSLFSKLVGENVCGSTQRHPSKQWLRATVRFLLRW